jgi:hypothetical protein
MPVTLPTSIERPEDAVEVIAQILEDSTIDVEVLKYDDSFITRYPAVQIMSGGLTKEIHGLHTWILTIRADIYVMHAQLTEDRQTRNYNDLQLATQIVNLLENQPAPGGDVSGLTLGGRIIGGWVENEKPGRMPPSGITKGKSVIGSLLSWCGTNEGRF